MSHIAVIVPVYNERRWVGPSVRRLLATRPPCAPGGDKPCPRTVYLVDDGSTDGSQDELRELAKLPGVAALFHASNRGKGAAIATGLGAALRDGAGIVLIHDADMEYDPADHEALVKPILDGRADAVIGSRFIGGTHRVLYFWHSVANKGLTLLSNMLTNLNLTDIECCLKAFRREAIERITITEPRFGVEPELVAKLSRLRLPGKRGGVSGGHASTRCR